MKTLSLGQGLKTMENNPVMQTALKIDDTKIKKANEIKYKSTRKLIQSSHSTLQELSASLNLSINVSNIAPELQAGFSRQLKSDGVNSYLVLTFTQILSTESLVSSTYSADTEAANLLAKSLPRFYEGHGDKFIKAVSYGRELTAIIQLKEQNFSQTMKGDVKAGIKTTAVEAATEFHTLLQDIDNSQIANIFYYVSGSEEPELTLAENIEELYRLTDLLKTKATPTKTTTTTTEEPTVATTTTTADKEEKTKSIKLNAEPVQVDYEAADYSETLDTAAAHSLKRKIIANQKLLAKISECHQMLNGYNELIEYALNNGSLFKLTTRVSDELEATHAEIANYINQLKDMASDITQAPFVENDVLAERVETLNTIVTKINTMQTSLVDLRNKEFLVAEFDADYSKIVSGKKQFHRNSHYQQIHMPPLTKNLKFEVFELNANGDETIAEGVQFKVKEKQPVKDKTLYKKLESGMSVEPITDLATVCIADLKKVANAGAGENFIVRFYAKIGNTFPVISQLSLERLQSLNTNPSDLSFFNTVVQPQPSQPKNESFISTLYKYVFGG